MFGFGQLIDILKKNPKKIVFTEGNDPRILEAASRLLASNFLHPILVGNPDEIAKVAEESGFNIRGAEIIDPMKYDRFDEMVEMFCELRKSKGVTPEQARGILSQANYFGTMLVKMGVADSLLGGATYSTADTVRPALQLIKTKPGNTIVSSCFIMVRPAATGENEVLAMADCAINIHPTEDELVEIAGETAECAKIFGIDPKVAFLSYSTLGSGKGEDVDKMRNAAAKAKEKYPELSIYKSKDTYLEIMEGQANKADAVKILCDSMNINIKHSISFGDNYNDIDMLKTTGKSYAMGNAPEEVKMQADYVTLDNNNEGIFEVLKKYSFK